MVVTDDVGMMVKRGRASGWRNGPHKEPTDGGAGLAGRGHTHRDTVSFGGSVLLHISLSEHLEVVPMGVLPTALDGGTNWTLIDHLERHKGPSDRRKNTCGQIR